MSDKAEKKDAAADKKGDKGGHDAAGDKPAKAGLLSKTPVVLGVAMLLQAVVLFVGFKILGGGGAKPAVGAEVTSAEGGDAKEGGEKGTEGKGEAKSAEGHDEAKPAESKGEEGKGEGKEAPPKKVDKKRKVELKVVDFRAPNKQGGRMFLYDVAIVISVRGVSEDKAKSALTENDARVKDRIRTIIAQINPEKLSEPGLETLRRQVKFQLEQILGDNVIDEVYVPRCIPFPVDY